MNKLSIVIPCYNEGEGIPLLLDGIKNSIKDRTDIEVILVNNGSTDNSADILEMTANHFPFLKVVTVPVNQGYGFGILAGLRMASGEYIGWMHGDLQTSFDDVIRCLKEIEILSSPKEILIKGWRRGRPLFDRFFSFGMGLFETFLLRAWLLEVNAQPNIFHRSFFASWPNPPYDFSLDLYVFWLARKQGLRVVRIPVIFPKRKFGKSHWNFSASMRWKFIKRTIIYSLALRRSIC